MNDKKPYKEPQTEFEILNAQLRIARWSARKMLELEEKLELLNRKKPEIKLKRQKR